MRFYRGRFENGLYGYEITDILANVWTTETPYGTKTEVFIQDFAGNVSFGWVGTHFTQNDDGTYRIDGLEGGDGARPVKYWMPIQPPYENRSHWHSEYFEEDEPPRFPGNQYLVCIERNDYGRTEYRMQVATWQKSGWYCKNVIAWREIPKAKKG